MTSTTRAKMHCSELSLNEYGNQTAKLYAVYGGSTEDNSFAAATPSAELSIMISNPAVKGFFEPGKDYYLDFTPA